MDINYGDIIVLNSELKEKTLECIRDYYRKKNITVRFTEMGCIFPVKDHKIGRKRRNM